MKVPAFHTIKLGKTYIAFKLQKETEGAASQDVLSERDVVTSRKMKEAYPNNTEKQNRSVKKKKSLYIK